MSVILDCGSTARRVDHNRVQSCAARLAHPCFDIGCRKGMRFRLAAHVMGQGPTAACTFGHNHLAAQTAQQANCGIVDIRIQRPLCASRHQSNPHFARAMRRKTLCIIIATNGRDLRRHHVQHRLEPRIRHQKGKRLPNLRPQKCKAKPCRIGQNFRQGKAQNTIHKGALIGALNMGAGVVDQMHVMHPRRAGGHAGQTGQAAVNMFDGLCVCWAPRFKHILDQVNPPTRTV